MNQAYSLKVLGQKIIERFKKRGLTISEELAEKIAKDIYLGTKEWVQESAAFTEMKVDDVGAGFFGFLDPIVLPAIDGIDIDGDGK